MSNKWLTTLYVGVTNNLERRVLEHKLGIGSDFSSRYNLTILLYFEESSSIQDAIAREKQLKSWKRQWKMDLIKTKNPGFVDISKDWYDEELLKR